MFSPLEQFSVNSLFCISDFLHVHFSNSNFQLILVVCIFLFFRGAYYFIPRRFEYIFEKVIFFVKSMIETNIGSFYLIYFVFLFTLFLLLAIANLSGMVPYTFTVTSHLIFTFCLSFMCFFAVNYIGIVKHGISFLGLFFPAGAPVLLAPLLVFIEILSYVARVFSLAIRLFANMMSGHTLLKILSEFAWVLFGSLGVGTIIFLFPVIIVFLITGLEIAIALLQAYVFVILVCIYFNDSIHLH